MVKWDPFRIMYDARDIMDPLFQSIRCGLSVNNVWWDYPHGRPVAASSKVKIIIVYWLW